MKFKDSKQFIVSFLKNPKKILQAITIGTSIFIGSNKLSAQQITTIKTLDRNLLIYEPEKIISSKTYVLNPGVNEDKFIREGIEYRTGKKLSKGQYNYALEIGRNNLFVNGKLVPDKLYSQIHTTLRLSEILNSPITLDLGYSKSINNFKLKGLNLLNEAEFLATVKNKKDNLGVSGSLYIEDGKIKKYNGITGFKFDHNLYSAGIRVYGNSKTKTNFYGVFGTADIGEKGTVFKTSLELGYLSNPESHKKYPSVNFSLFLKPKNGDFKIYFERQTSLMSGQGGVLVELNYLIKEREKKLKSLNKNKFPKKKRKRYPMVDPPKKPRGL